MHWMLRRWRYDIVELKLNYRVENFFRSEWQELKGTGGLSGCSPSILRIILGDVPYSFAPPKKKSVRAEQLDFGPTIRSKLHPIAPKNNNGSFSAFNHWIGGKIYRKP